MSWIQFGKKYSSLKSQAFIGGLEMKCQKCGTENEAGVRFCKKCGHEMRLSMGVDPSGNTGNNSYAVSSSGSSYNGSEDNTPITMWGYFGYQLLFSIPCVGIILILMFSFGGTKNVNLRNYARSQFCYWIVIAVLLLILTLAGGGLAGILTRSYY